MSIHQTAPTQWVPVTDEILRSLEGQYLTWIIDLTEIRDRMAKLREAFKAGWKPDEISQSNLDRLNARDEWNAMHNMDNARTILTCAEHFAAPYMPGTAENRNEYFLAALRLAAEKNRPTSEQMEAFRRGMLEGRIPWPAGTERQQVRAILKDMLEKRKTKH
ncbi:hypothetical protein [Bradyrhizobium liaoningense]